MPSADIIYHWNVTPFSASIDSSRATFNTPNTYICTVTNTLTGCSTPIQVVVTTNTTVPTITISGTQTLTCANPTAVFQLLQVLQLHTHGQELLFLVRVQEASL